MVLKEFTNTNVFNQDFKWMYSIMILNECIQLIILKEFIKLYTNLSVLILNFEVGNKTRYVLN